MRLTGNTKTYQGIQPVAAGSLKPGNYSNIPITHKGIHTNLDIIHEPGHKEAWIIAMSASSSNYKTLDYGMRWGIEAMFSDFKIRGLSLESSQMKKHDHLDRIVLMLAIALYWAVSTAYWVSLHESCLYS